VQQKRPGLLLLERRAGSPPANVAKQPATFDTRQIHTPALGQPVHRFVPWHVLKLFEWRLITCESVLKQFESVIKSFESVLKFDESVLTSFESVLTFFEYVLTSFESVLTFFEYVLKFDESKGGIGEPGSPDFGRKRAKTAELRSLRHHLFQEDPIPAIS